MLGHRLGITAAVGCHWHTFRELAQRNEIHATEIMNWINRAPFNSFASLGCNSLKGLNVKSTPALRNASRVRGSDRAQGNGGTLLNCYFDNAATDQANERK